MYQDLASIISVIVAAGRKPSGFAAFINNSPDGLRRTATSRTATICAVPLQFATMHDDPIAFFITWSCYGTWLPGDERGWTKWHKGQQIPQPFLADWCREKMTEEAIYLDDQQRMIVNSVIAEHCGIRSWHLHAVNCRSNHCHVVVTAIGYEGEQVRDQFKAWGKRKLKEHQRRTPASDPVREHWWTRKGSVRYIFDEESLEAAIRYTLEAQDCGGSKCDVR